MAEMLYSPNDDEELELLSALENYFKETSDRIYLESLPHWKTLDQQRGKEIVRRFARFGLVRFVGHLDIVILPALIEAAGKTREKRVKDYWKSTIAWFRSKWWSVPVLLIAVVLPLLVTWIEMVQTVLRWMGLLD